MNHHCQLIPGKERKRKGLEKGKKYGLTILS
jgi:hypothetical protein